MELIPAIFQGLKALILITAAVTLSVVAILLLVYAVRRLLRNSFARDRYLGLSSETFDLTNNINDDTRRGLNVKAKFTVLAIMLWFGETFDEARARYVQRAFASNNIGPDGRPRDPKAVFFD